MDKVFTGNHVHRFCKSLEFWLGAVSKAIFEKRIMEPIRKQQQHRIEGIQSFARY
jgi:hypothetical protein